MAFVGSYTLTAPTGTSTMQIPYGMSDSSGNGINSGCMFSHICIAGNAASGQLTIQFDVHASAVSHTQGSNGVPVAIPAGARSLQIVSANTAYIQFGRMT